MQQAALGPKQSTPRSTGVFCILAVFRHTGPHTSALPPALLAPAASLCRLLSWRRKECGSAHLSLRLRCACPAGKLHSASALLRTPCLLCRRNSSFPAVQWMRWGACAPGNKEIQSLVRAAFSIPRAAGAGRRSHIAAARRRKPEKAKSHISPLFWLFRWEKRKHRPT